MAKANRPRALGKVELIAIALGGMIGGGIFSILGVSVSIIGFATPVAILLGGLLALAAAFSYAKLAVLFKDEGATYSFFKKTYPDHRFAIAAIGWLIVFGYVSTLALYAYTFSSYFTSFVGWRGYWQLRIVAFAIIFVFAGLNLLSVRGMGKVEDILVYTKVGILLVISALFVQKGHRPHFFENFANDFQFGHILIVSAITFVAYEGFQLVIHAYNEARDPDRNVPSSIYWAICAATLLYVVLAVGALYTIPLQTLIRDKEYALAGGASDVLGQVGYVIVIVGALLATSSAINGTIFGASRLMAVIAKDGVFPKIFAKRIKTHIPHYAILAMSLLAFIFILSGGLQSILEFGSITFIIVSFLMAVCNFKNRRETHTHGVIAVFSMIFLGAGAIAIVVYEYYTDPSQVFYIFALYILLSVFAKLSTLGMRKAI